MTNVNLHQSAPTTIADVVGEVFSATLLVLSGALTLVTLVTI